METVRIDGSTWLERAASYVSVPILTFLGIWGIIGTLYLCIPTTSRSGQALFLALLLSALAVALIALRRLDPSRGSLLPSLTDAQFLLLIMTIGVALRYLVYHYFPAPQWADARVYVRLADIVLSEGRYYLYGDYPGQYYLDHSYAWWPPGVVGWLVVWKWLLGDWAHLLFTQNAVLFVLASLGLWKISAPLEDRDSRRLAQLLFAAYPNFVYQAMFATKEALAIVLLIWGLYLLYHAPPLRKCAWLPYVAAGALLGYATLTQPTLELVPLVLLIYEGFFSREAGRFRRFALMCIGIVLIISPWSVRNYLVLDEFIPITSGSGYSLLAGNLPNSYGAQGVPEVPDHLTEEQWRDELLRGRESWRLAKEWIRAHPSEFARLTVLRQFYFLGEGDRGAIMALRNELHIHGPTLLRHSLLSQSYTFMIWLLVAIVSGKALLGGYRPRGVAIIWLGIFFYIFLVHSVMESSGRYQTTPIPFLFLLLGYLWRPPTAGAPEAVPQQ